MTIVAPPMRSRRSSIAAWLAMVGGPVAAIAVLHQLGNDASFAAEPGRIWTWLGEASPEVALLGIGRRVALGLSYWIAGSALLYTAARASRIPQLVRGVEWLTLPAVRRVSERVVAVSLTISTVTTAGASVAAAAGADPAGPASPAAVTLETTAPDAGYVPVPAEDGREIVSAGHQIEGEGEPYVPSPAGETSGDERVAPPPFLVWTSPTTTDEGAGTEGIEPFVTQGSSPAARNAARSTIDYTVRSGDHLWGIAERHLDTALGRIGSEAEVATYWSHIIDVNRDRLRSGDPNLIFPGEVVECPPIGDAGIS